ncbi:MAG: hypothetical protein ACK55D_10335 [Synechococcaceae cyanobacterium]
MALATAGCFLSFSSAQPVNAEYVKNGGFSINSIAGVYDSSFINGTQAVTIEDWSVSTSYSFIVSDGDSVASNLNLTDNGPDPVWGTPIAGKDGTFPLGLYATGQTVNSPDGSGWFIASDGSYGADARITQTVAGLVPGMQYELSYFIAGGQQQGFTGDATAFWRAFLNGAETTPPPVISISSQSAVTPWYQHKTTFTSTGSELLLEFVADGAPSGQMPFSLLSGVSIVDHAPPSPSVPGPLPAMGFGMALAWSRKLRSRVARSAQGESGADS